MSTNMPPLWLDYHRPPPGRQLPGILLLVISLFLSALLLNTAMDIATESAATERHVAKLRQAAERRRLFAATEPSTAASGDSEKPQPASASAHRWESLLNALETANDDNVTLLSLTPGLREIVITGEARGLDEALDYANRLQGSGVFNHAHLSKYERVREHPHHPVFFTLLAEWREVLP